MRPLSTAGMPADLAISAAVRGSTTEKKIKNALTYPIIVAIVAVLVVGVLVTFVLPTFTNLYA